MSHYINNNVDSILHLSKYEAALARLTSTYSASNIHIKDDTLVLRGERSSPKAMRAYHERLARAGSATPSSPPRRSKDASLNEGAARRSPECHETALEALARRANSVDQPTTAAAPVYFFREDGEKEAEAGKEVLITPYRRVREYSAYEWNDKTPRSAARIHPFDRRSAEVLYASSSVLVPSGGSVPWPTRGGGDGLSSSSPAPTYSSMHARKVEQQQATWTLNETSAVSASRLATRHAHVDPCVLRQRAVIATGPLRELPRPRRRSPSASFTRGRANTGLAPPPRLSTQQQHVPSTSPAARGSWAVAQQGLIRPKGRSMVVTFSDEDRRRVGQHALRASDEFIERDHHQAREALERARANVRACLRGDL